MAEGEEMVTDYRIVPHAGCGPERGERAAAALLSRVPIFAPLDDRELQALAEACCSRAFRPHEVLFHEEDPGNVLYLLQSGRVKVVLVASHGEETILHVCGPGECLGELSLMDGAPRCATAVALEPVEALALYREEFLTLIERYPRVALAVMGRLAGIVRHLNQQLQDVVLLNVPSRLAKTLLELADQHGEATPDGIHLAVRLTQEELGQMIGAARSNVNKYLTAFAERGILTADREGITIHKPHELRKRIA